MSDIYRIGVAIGISGNAAEALQALAGKVLGLNLAVKDLQGGFNRVKLAALGLAGVYVSDKILHGFNDMAEAGARLQSQQTAMAQAGMTHLQIVQETARAYASMSEVRGPDIAERIAAIRELRGIVGAGSGGNDYREINSVLPSYLRVRSLYGERGSNDLFRTIELEGGARYKPDGQFDQARFELYLDASLRTLQAGGGNIKPRDLLNVLQMSSVTARAMDPNAFWNTMMTPILEMGGHRAGTALTALSRDVFGGIVPERFAREQERIGILSGRLVRTVGNLTREQRADLRKHGYTINRDHTISIGKDSIVGAKVLDDPTQGVFPWIRDYVLPNLQRDYRDKLAHHPGSHETFDAYIGHEIPQLFGTDTARRIVALLSTQGTSVQRDQTARSQATGLSAYDLAQQNYAAQLDNFHHSVKSFMETLGLPAARDGAHILQVLGSGIDHFTQILARNPGMAQVIERLGIAVGVLSGAFGVTAIGATILGMVRLGGATRSLAISLSESAAIIERAQVSQSMGVGVAASQGAQGGGKRQLLRTAASYGVLGMAEFGLEYAYDGYNHREDTEAFHRYRLAHMNEHLTLDEGLRPWLYRYKWADYYKTPDQSSSQTPSRTPQVYTSTQKLGKSPAATQTPTPQTLQWVTHVNLDSKKIAQVMQEIQMTQTRQNGMSGGSGADHLANPPRPGH